MFGKIKDYFLKPYINNDYLTHQRAIIFYFISFTIIVVVIFYHILIRIRGLTDFAVLTPLSITGIISLFSLYLLRKGNLKLVPHLLLVTCLSATWVALFFENADAIGRLDTIVLLVGILSLVPLVISRKKFSIILYFLANGIVFILFTLKAQKDLGLSSSVLFEYRIDVLLTLFVAGTSSYLIFTIYTNTLQRAQISELTIQKQYLEIEKQNEQLTSANEEFETINEDLILTHEKLSREKELLSTTLRSIKDAVMTTDREGNIVLMNRTAETISQHTAIEGKGKTFNEVVDIRTADTNEPFHNPALQVVNNGGIFESSQDLILQKKNGSKRNITLTAAPVHDNRSRITGAVIVLRDITEEKRIEKELHKVSKIENLGVFAGGIAHDFNNIVTSAMGNISMAKYHLEDNEKIWNYIVEAEEALLKTRDLTHQLLTFTKGGDPLKETASIKEIIESAAKFVLSGSQIEWSCDLSEDLWNAMIDKGQISQVIHNIVLNARQAMPDSGRVDIVAKNITVSPGESTPLNEGDHVKITISDEGPGIPEENRDRIFAPFFTTKKEGSGLGLAISFSIIKKHNGHINILPAKEKGSSFEIYLPATREEVPKNTHDFNFNFSRPGRILLLDDDEKILAIMKRMLTSIGFEITVTNTGEDTINLYRNAKDSGRDFDCVILDLTIRGGMGGEKTLRILREYDKDILAVVSSGYANDPIIANYRNYGFSGAIQKPFRLEELRKVLSEVMNGS